MGKRCDMRGFLTFTVLRLTSKEEMSGDDIRCELERRKGSKPSPGTIYPALKSMSKNGWIREVSSGGREKKYRITQRGRKELDAAIRKFVAMFCDMRKEFEKVSSKK